MAIWESLEFGARALGLRLAATKSLKEILEVQRSRLNELVEYAGTHSTFYRETFAGINDSSFDLTDLPTSTKSELMDHFDEAVTVPDVHRSEVEDFLADEANLGKYFREKYVLSHTSGSQGRSLLIVQTKENIELLFALQASRGNHHRLNVWDAAKYFLSPARLAAVLLKRGFYPSASAFAYMPEGAQRYLEVLQVSLTDNDLIEQITKFRPTHLTAYASVLHELARQTEAGRLTLKPELEQVVNISERLVPQARKHYVEMFGAPILDDYAMGECPFLTNGCLSSGGMHVNADWAIVEVVDEHNRPVPNGTKGAKVLVTNLANLVQPIIRYEIGDIVTMATQPCGCGSNLPRIESVEGRDSEMFWIEAEAGVRPCSSVVFEEALGYIVDIREYQLIQEDINRFRILIEPLPGANLDRQRALRILHKELAKYDLDQGLELEIEIVERLQAEDGNKFRRVVNKVRPPQNKNGEVVCRHLKTSAGTIG